MRETCGTCRYFWRAKADEGRDAIERIGNCRRHAPSRAVDGGPVLSDFRAQWPTVSPRWWCGDYEREPLPPITDAQREAWADLPMVSQEQVDAVAEVMNSLKDDPIGAGCGFRIG